MATRRTAPLPEQEEPEHQDLPLDVAQPATELDALQSLMGELAGSSSAKITVYRCTRNQPQAYVFQCSPEGFSLDDLRDKYNGGEFRLYISRNGALWKNIKVCVEPGQVAGVAEPAPAAAAELAAVLRDGLARQAEAVRELVQRASSAPPSPFAGLDIPAVITAISAALTALRPPPAPAPLPVDSDRGIDMLLKGIELARELSPSGGAAGEQSMLGVLSDLVKSPLLAQAVGAMAAQGAQAQGPARRQAPAHQQVPALQAPAQAIPKPAPVLDQGQARNGENDVLPRILKQYLPMLVARAAEGSDPGLYADLVLDNVPDTMLRDVLALRPSPLDALIAAHSPVQRHWAWFRALLTAVQDEVYSREPQNQPVEDASQHPAPDVPR